MNLEQLEEQLDLEFYGKRIKLFGRKVKVKLIELEEEDDLFVITINARIKLKTKDINQLISDLQSDIVK